MTVKNTSVEGSTRQLDAWLEALERRHLADLRFPEVTRALRALSITYVTRRTPLGSRPLQGAGKRAAFAMFYGPLHFLMTQAIVEGIPGATHVGGVLDVGCGTGAAGAAWASAAVPSATIVGVDVHPWTLEEAAWTYRCFSLRADIRRADASTFQVPRGVDGVLAAFVVNELEPGTRDALRSQLLARGARGVQVLIIEPIAKSITPWWREWESAFKAIGGRSDEWRVRLPLPPLLKRLDQATGLRHDELTARTLYVGG